MEVARARISASRLSCCGSRCCARTYAKPVSGESPPQELLEGLEAARGGPDPDDEQALSFSVAPLRLLFLDAAGRRGNRVGHEVL
jgi:hypothetical protein